MTAAKAVAVYAPPAYWEDARKHLMKRDRVMKRLIPQFGDGCLQTRGDAFVTLARSIVGQQISVKAAQTVWDRFVVLPKKFSAANVLKLKVDDMRAAGLSARKVEYLVDLALHFCEPHQPGDRVGNHGRRSHHCRADRHSGHRTLDRRNVSDLSHAAAQCTAAR